MNRQEKIIKARQEAQRFLDRCEELMDRYAKDEDMRRYFECGGASKEMGALKRASMDLSRALTELRR